MKPIIIGIAGGSGSGKSTLAQALLDALAPDALCLVHDRYYRDLTPEEQVSPCSVNFDHPDALDTPRLLADLRDLVRVGRAQVPIYAFASHSRTGTESIDTKRFVVVEGILVFTDPTLCDAMDLRVYVDAPESVRLSRRIVRDMALRGRSEEQIRTRFEQMVGPMHETFVEPSRASAHHIVDGTAPLSETVASVLRWIKALD